MYNYVIKIYSQDSTEGYYVPVKADSEDKAVTWAYAKLEDFLGYQVFGPYEVEHKTVPPDPGLEEG